MAGPAYAPLLKDGYVSQDKPDAAESGHPGTPARLTALREVTNDVGATVKPGGAGLAYRRRGPADRRRNWTRAWPRWTWS
jgi:hypothetical protein